MKNYIVRRYSHALGALWLLTSCGTSETTNLGARGVVAPVSQPDSPVESSVGLTIKQIFGGGGGTTTIKGPTQPKTGPGGSNYPYPNAPTVSGVGGIGGYTIVEPSPKPKGLVPVVMFVHGSCSPCNLLEKSFSYKGFVKHLAQKGNIVIYPFYQISGYKPDNQPQVALDAMKAAVQHMRANPATHAQPDMTKFGMVTHSKGGPVGINALSLGVAAGLGHPNFMFAIQPANFVTGENPMLNLSLIPADMLFVTSVGQDDPTTGENASLYGAGPIYNALPQIPNNLKSYIRVQSDNHGTPALVASHNVVTPQVLDAYDWYYGYKIADALRDCTVNGTNCEYALGNTAQQRNMGLWSDSVPVKNLCPTNNLSETWDVSCSTAGGTGGGATGAPTFGALEKMLKEKVSSGLIKGYAMQFYDRDDSLLFQSEAGVCAAAAFCPTVNAPFTVNLVTTVASSSKWVTSTTLLASLEDLVASGKISSVAAGLDTSVGSVLTATCRASKLGRGANVTTRQLMSFTSGLLPDHDCVGNSSYTMKTCACKILADSALAEVANPTDGTPGKNAQPPGTVYKYGGAQQVVAAAMLEVQTGQSFESLYNANVKIPLGLNASYKRTTAVSGSLQTSVAEYAKFVRAQFHDGQAGGTGKLLSAATLAEQEKSQMPANIIYLTAPQKGSEYGLNTWRWCNLYAPADKVLALDATVYVTDPTCSAVHQQGHGGKGGYQPFVDRKREFYGVFAMREPSPGGGADYTDTEAGLTAAVRYYAGLVVEEMRKNTVTQP